MKRFITIAVSVVIGAASAWAQDITDTLKVCNLQDSLKVCCKQDTLKVCCNPDSLKVCCQQDSLKVCDLPDAVKAVDTDVVKPDNTEKPDKAQNAGKTEKADVAGKAENEAVKADAGKAVTEAEVPAKQDKTEKAKAEKGHSTGFYIALQGGPVLNVYENYFSFSENGQTAKMITPQSAAILGYDFSTAFGVRLQVAYGNDMGACNVKETSAGGFYPYGFQHINGFVDAMLDLGGLSGKKKHFHPRFYIGGGLAHTFNFADSGHPWQKVNSPNTVLGFRGGVVTEYRWNSGLGIYADLCGEGYTDSYNGLQPTEADKAGKDGYPGFPLDLRGILSLGIVYHF